MADDGVKYCVKCKERFNSRLAPNPDRCPRCDHKVTFAEDFNYQFFGSLGANTGCGCWIVIAIIVIVLIAIVVG